MAEQGPKVGDARSLWNFTPSPGILLLYVFFLSLSLFARVCCDDDDVLVLGTFVSRLNFWNDDVETMRFLVLHLARLSLSLENETTLESGSVFVPLLYSL